MSAVRSWLFAPRPIQPLVIARIVFGGVVFLCHLVRLPDLQTLYGPEGLVGPRWFPQLKPYKGGFSWDAEAALWLDRILPPLTPELIAALYALLLVASLCFALGFRTRASGIVTLLLFVYFSRARLPFAYWGWPRHLQALMLYVIAAPTGRQLSLDAWLRGDRTASWLAPAWPLRLMQVHTCALYALVGLARLDDLGWWHGQVVYAALADAQFSRILIDWQPWKPLLSLATWGAFALEPLAPVLLWIPRIGPLWAYALIAMHTGLELTTNIGWWSYVMVASLLCFLPTAHVDAILRRVTSAAPGRG